MSKKKIRKAKSKKAYKVRLKPSTVLSIVQIVFYSLAGLIIVSFSRRGLILVILNDFLLLLFSWTTIFVPFIFVSLGLLVSKLRVPIAQPNVIVGALLFFISIMSLTKAVSNEPLEQKLVSNVAGEDKIWKYPPLSLLTEISHGKADRGDIKGNAATIEQTLESFGIAARVVEVNLGPAVTQYAIEVALGTKLSKITA